VKAGTPKTAERRWSSGSHNKHLGCGASGAYAPSPDEYEYEGLKVHEARRRTEFNPWRWW
jgi:hypothetical protein